MPAQIIEDVVVLNEVHLVGRLAAEAEERTLPSGDSLVSFRVVVPREGEAARRQPVDTLECVVWSGRVKRSAMRWRPGDTVDVSGQLRRRFFRTPAGSASRVEVQVTAGRVVHRARTG